MKTLLILTCLLLMAVPCMAQGNKSITFTWDPPASADLPNIKSTRLYTISSTGTYTQIGESVCTLGTPNVCPNTLTVTIVVPGIYSFVAHFYDGVQDSADSNVVTTPVGPPGHLKK